MWPIKNYTIHENVSDVNAKLKENDSILQNNHYNVQGARFRDVWEVKFPLNILMTSKINYF